MRSRERLFAPALSVGLTGTGDEHTQAHDGHEC